jgi:hypothetical protein
MVERTDVAHVVVYDLRRACYSYQQETYESQICLVYGTNV